MMLFWMGVAFLVLLALFCVWITWRFYQRRSMASTAREHLSAAFYQQRLDELKIESEQGLVFDEPRLVIDLKQSLLDDIPVERDNNQPMLPVVEKRLVFILSTAVLLLCVGMYTWVGGYHQVSHWQQVQHSTPALTQKLITSHGVLTPSDRQDLLLALRTRLADKPDDTTGWMMLGRVATVAQNNAIAIPAFAKAHDLSKQDDSITFAYGQSLILTSNSGLQQQGRDLLLPLLTKPSIAFNVLSLLAYDAFSQQKYGDAIAYWQKMQNAIPVDDKRYAKLVDNIAKAQQLLSDNNKSRGQ